MYYGIGLKIYDLLSGKIKPWQKTKMLNKAEAKNYLPGINDEKLKGGILYYDGQFDDTRLCDRYCRNCCKTRSCAIELLLRYRARKER